jgi:ribosomal protein S4E
MDVVQLETLGSFRILMDNRGNLVPKEISTEEVGFKLCRIAGKRNIKRGGFQLSFHDGTTVAGEFKELKPLDVLKLQLPELKIIDKIPFEKGITAFITGGSNTAKVGKIVEIKEIKRAPNLVTLEADGKTFNAPANYVFGVGREKPIISI